MICGRLCNYLPVEYSIFTDTSFTLVMTTFYL